MKVAALIGVLGILAPTLAAQSTVTVEGRVVNSVTGGGVPDSAVRLFSRDRGVNMSIPGVLTDEAGSFLVGLKPGDYGALAEKQGYSNKGMFLFHVNADGNSNKLRLEIVPPATLRGRVLGIDGQPTKATVDLGGTRSLRNVPTNEDGYFFFDQLGQGTYTLLAQPEGVESVLTQEGIRTGVVPTYYPSSVERIQAESIGVRPGEDLSGYEIRLQSARVYRVSGVVLDPVGKPVSDATVQLRDGAATGTTPFRRGGAFSILSSSADAPNSTQSATAQSAVTGDEGEFEFLSVRPGNWTVYAESEVRDQIQQQDGFGFGTAGISVGSRDLENVTIRLALPIDISGTVEGGDASPEIVRSVEVSLIGENGHFGGSAHPDRTGTLRFEGVIPGRYRISADASSDYYASVLLGSTDVTDQTVDLITPYTIRVVLKRGGTFRWTLEPAKSWTVVLMPQDLTGVGYTAQDFAPGMELTGIPPGQYYAIALDRFDRRTMTDVRTLRELVPNATSVRIESGSVSFTQLKINHAPD